MALTKLTSEVSLFAIASVASADQQVGIGATGVDVSTYYAGIVRVRMGRATATAFTNPPEIRIEGAIKTSPTDNDWVTLQAVSPAIGFGTIGSSAVSGTEAIGQTVVSLTSGTNFAAGQFIFFHNGTIANSEWKRIKSVATNDLTLQDAIVFAQTGATARNQAEEFFIPVDLTSFNRLRVVVNNSPVGGSGQAVIIEAALGAVSAL